MYVYFLLLKNNLSINLINTPIDNLLHLGKILKLVSSSGKLFPWQPSHIQGTIVIYFATILI
jgi:hypothetical protein